MDAKEFREAIEHIAEDVKIARAVLPRMDVDINFGVMSGDAFALLVEIGAKRTAHLQRGGSKVMEAASLTVGGVRVVGYLGPRAIVASDLELLRAGGEG